MRGYRYGYYEKNGKEVAIKVVQNKKKDKVKYDGKTCYYSNLEDLDENKFTENFEAFIDFERKNFVWGIVNKVHSIGNITIFEYTPRSTVYVDPAVSFHTYIGTEDTSQTDSSLDGALLCALGYKYEGTNSQFAMFATRMLNM